MPSPRPWAPRAQEVCCPLLPGAPTGLGHGGGGGALGTGEERVGGSRHLLLPAAICSLTWSLTPSSQMGFSSLGGGGSWRSWSPDPGPDYTLGLSAPPPASQEGWRPVNEGRSPCKATPQGRTVRVCETEQVLGWWAHLGAPPTPGSCSSAHPSSHPFNRKTKERVS